MRLGLLDFAGQPPEPLLKWLQEQDVDTILPDAPLADRESVREQAQRLVRADCDAVAFFVGRETEPEWVALAGLLLTRPLLLCGRPDPGYGRAVAALHRLGIPFARKLTDSGDAALTRWLTENRKAARQPGIAAAQRLFGRRLCLSVPPAGMDFLQWERQFGLTVSAGPPESGDLVSRLADPYEALAELLLSAIGGEGAAPAHIIPLGEPIPAGVTWCQIAPLPGRLYCRMGEGPIGENQLAATVLSGSFVAAEGDYSAALRAACDTLGIECAPFRFPPEQEAI